MTDRLHYKGFTSTPKYSAEDDMFYGTVDDVDAVVIYDSETAVGLKAAFMEAVDDYLDATDVAEIRFLVDQETLGWLERESARTGISLEKVASAMLRKACNEASALGAPDTIVEVAFEGDEPNGYPKPMDPKDVEARIVGEVDEHGRTVLPAEEYCEEDDVYDELYPAPFASEAEACDFADAAARDAIDGRRVNQSTFS